MENKQKKIRLFEQTVFSSCVSITCLHGLQLSKRPSNDRSLFVFGKESLDIALLLLGLETNGVIGVGDKLGFASF